MTPGAELESWWPLALPLIGFGLIVVALVVAGRRARPAGGWPLWIPTALERVTTIPGWAAAMIGTAAFGLLVAGIGFYNDVAWHVGRGRDEELLTAPHTMILVGLGFITLAAALGVAFASLQRADTELRWASLRIPWSAVPLGLLGLCALGGFPLDELWHATYGIDVTMWSPTHLIMICGAAFSLIAAWLVLAEAGVEFRRNVWTRIAHVIAAWFVLAGLTAPLGEFRFGVPQFQQLYHPVILLLATAFTFCAVRLVLGRGWSVVVALAAFLPEVFGLMQLGGTESDFVPTRSPGSYVAAAVAVELAAWLVGTERLVRFALAAGVGVATIGLAGEWAWNVDATQPWRSPLLVSAVVVGGATALGAAVLGTAYGRAVGRRPGQLPGALVGVAALVVVGAMVFALPRRVPTDDVVATIELEPTADETAAGVTVRLDPPSAADDARWFQVISWQGGGFRSDDLDEVEPGVFRTDEALPITGHWKTMVRLHRSDELLSAPVFLPADPEIDAPEVPAEDRTIVMGGEGQYLMREVKPGSGTVEVIAYVLTGGVTLLWAGAFAIACSRISRRPGSPTGDPTREPAYVGAR
jgi:hypothetical protein